MEATIHISQWGVASFGESDDPPYEDQVAAKRNNLADVTVKCRTACQFRAIVVFSREIQIVEAVCEL